MKLSHLAPNPNMLRVSGQNIPESLRRFNFRVSEFRTLYAASGFMDPPLFASREGSCGRETKMSFSLRSQKSSEGDYFYPAEVVFKGDRILVNESQDITIFTDPYCGMLGQGSYPGNVRTLIEDVWKGDLLPAGKYQHRLFFKDRGVSVVFGTNMETLVGGSIALNHVLLLVGESTSFRSQPRFAARMTYSQISFSDMIASSAAGALFSLAMNISADNAAK